MRDFTPTLEQVKKLIDARQYREAGTILDMIIAEEPNEPLAWRERAFLRHRVKHFEEALSDIEMAIFLDVQEPSFHFTRARWLIDGLRFAEAIEELNTCLDLELSLNHTYYVEACYFFRAIACIYLGLYDECLEDCARVREGDYHFWSLNRLYTKAELIDCATRRCVPPLKQRASAKNSAQEQ